MFGAPCARAGSSFGQEIREGKGIKRRLLVVSMATIHNWWRWEYFFFFSIFAINSVCFSCQKTLLH